MIIVKARVEKARQIAGELQNWLEDHEGLSMIPVANITESEYTLEICINHECIWSSEADSDDDLTFEYCQNAWVEYAGQVALSAGLTFALQGRPTGRWHECSEREAGIAATLAEIVPGDRDSSDVAIADLLGIIDTLRTKANVAESKLSRVTSAVQRYQPGGSPPPGDEPILVEWILASLRNRLRTQDDIDKLAAWPFVANPAQAFMAAAEAAATRKSNEATAHTAT